LRTCILAFALLAWSAARDRVPEKPNIVYILCDDLGYGDVTCLNKDSKIRTPHIDRLASRGMIFTDAHSGSAVCTPTRYGILTGRYAWRTQLRAGVLWGWSKPLIARGRTTVASLLKDEGYRTACIGKWHLGMDWPFDRPSDAPAWQSKSSGSPGMDYSKALLNGPTSVGFDYYFGISASLDMPPYVFIENDHTVGLPSVTKTLYPGRAGDAHPDFDAPSVLPELTKRAVAYLGERAKDKTPFFLYLPLNSPHTPIAPTGAFKGRSGINDYADFVMETDWSIGRVLDALEQNGQAGETLVIVTSDNGCSPSADFKVLAEHGHNPSYVFRGAKADIFEGGHHIPFVARWPGKVKPGSVCDDTVCLADLMATCAEIVGVKVPDDAGEDSVSILGDLLGTAQGPLREATVHQSMNGSLALRKGKWKLEMCGDSGGWSSPKPGSAEAKDLPPIQLYDMTGDISERRNVAAEHGDVVAELRALLQSYIDSGRSTPGAPRSNDVPVPITLKVANVKKE
jgi:arylsulfatase A-like enzyme